MIRKMIITALMASSAAVAAAQEPPSTVQSPVVETLPAAAPAAAAAAPAVDPARLAAARSFVDAAYQQALMERAIAAGVHNAAQAQRDDRQQARRDPHLAERTRIMERVVVEEASRILRDVDPNVRSLLADYYARRFSVADLEEGARFYASPLGRRFFEGALEIALSPGYDSAMRGLAPEVERALEGADQRYLAATAEIPPFPGERRPAAGAGSRRAPRSARRAPAAPPLPAADPARLAAATRMADAIWPDGLFERPLDLAPALEAVASMRVGDFGVPIPPQMRIDPNSTLAAIAASFDPHFSRRLPVLARFGAGEIVRVGTAIEPHWKRIAANFYAREFTVAELDGMSGFFSSPAGRRLSAANYNAIEDPALVRGFALLLPRLALQIPATMQRVEQATAHLPRPGAPGGRQSGEDHDHEDGGDHQH